MVPGLGVGKLLHVAHPARIPRMLASGTQLRHAKTNSPIVGGRRVNKLDRLRTYERAQEGRDAAGALRELHGLSGNDSRTLLAAASSQPQGILKEGF